MRLKRSGISWSNKYIPVLLGVEWLSLPMGYGLINKKEAERREERGSITSHSDPTRFGDTSTTL